MFWLFTFKKAVKKTRAHKWYYNINSKSWAKKFKKRASEVFSKNDIKLLKKKYPNGWF